MRHSLIGCQKANCFESRCFSLVWWSDCFIFCHEACFFADQCDSEFQTFGIHIGRGGENSFILVTNMTNMSICGFGLCVYASFSTHTLLTSPLTQAIESRDRKG